MASIAKSGRRIFSTRRVYTRSAPVVIVDLGQVDRSAEDAERDGREGEYRRAGLEVPADRFRGSAQCDVRMHLSVDYHAAHGENVERTVLLGECVLGRKRRVADYVRLIR